MIGQLSQKKSLFLGWIVLLSVIILLHVQSVRATVGCFDTSWPSDHSLLQPDPHLVRGRLANGFRYVIKKNREPKKRVAIYLDVQAGSLEENDQQRGLAHFLEHMMFNGSKHFPPGSLIEYFQSIGMGFGNDTNAHTGYGETVYSLVLPDGSESELEKGFLVTADYSRRALLLESEIERERGVILSEKRARDSAGFRTYVARSAFAYRGTRLPERLPIGTDKGIKGANHMLLASYYNAWYRPDNIILVVVGDVDPQKTEKLIQKSFSKLTAIGKKPVCPDFGRLQHKGTESFYHYEPELGKTNISIEVSWDEAVQDDSVALERRQILQYLGAKIMGYRLQRIQEEENPPFADAAYFSGDIVHRIKYGSIIAEADADHWAESLSFIDRTLRQAITYGFRQKELERAKKEIIAGIDRRVLTSQTTDSRKIGQSIVRNLNSNRVYQTPEQEQKLYDPIIERLTLEDVNREFRSIWNHDNRLVSVSGNVRLGKDGKSVILSKYRQSRSVAVKVENVTPKADFPYLKVDNQKVPIPKDKLMAEIGVEKLVFPNGLIVNLKKTTFAANSFQVAVSFGNGKLAESQPGMALLAQAVMNDSGSGKLTESAIDAITAGSSVHMNFKIDDAAFSWVGGALFKDFDLFVQLLHTRLFDPGVRESVFDRVKSRTELMYQQLRGEIEGAMALDVQPFLANYNSHFGLPPWSKISRIQFKELQSWVHLATKVQDLEISIVGDFDREKVIKTLGHYFGNIKLKNKLIQNSVQIQFPKGVSHKVTVDTSIHKAMVVVAWPTDDALNIGRTRRLNVLASVFEDRLRKEIRETMGATYSPNCFSWGSKVYSRYGFLYVQVTVKSGMENKIIEKIKSISNELYKNGVTAEELLRAKKPIVTSLGDTVRNNDYWLYSVLFQSNRYPQQLEWPKNIVSDYESIDKNEVSILAKRYLQNKKAAIVQVEPSFEKSQIK